MKTKSSDLCISSRLVRPLTPQSVSPKKRDESEGVSKWPEKSVNLTHFTLMFHFYNAWKRQESYSFMALLGCIEMKHCI